MMQSQFKENLQTINIFKVSFCIKDEFRYSLSCSIAKTEI